MHLLHFFLSEVASLNSARFIPVLSCISSIHFFLGRPLFFFPSPQANIISFSSPSVRMTCPKNPSFLRNAICCKGPSIKYVRSKLNFLDPPPPCCKVYV